MGGGPPVFVSWVHWVGEGGALAVLAMATGPGRRTRILADGAHCRSTKESLSCPGNPCSVPLPLPLGAFASERLKASSAECI